MHRQITNHRRTATVHNGEITIMGDDGWESMLDSRIQFASDAEAYAWLATGWEEFDPNAGLKAMGLVWNGYIYARPGL